MLVTLQVGLELVEFMSKAILLLFQVRNLVLNAFQFLSAGFALGLLQKIKLRFRVPQSRPNVSLLLDNMLHPRAIALLRRNGLGQVASLRVLDEPANPCPAIGHTGWNSTTGGACTRVQPPALVSASCQLLYRISLWISRPRVGAVETEPLEVTPTHAAFRRTHGSLHARWRSRAPRQGRGVCRERGGEDLGSESD